MIILGIDPGYAIVGYGVIEKDDKTGKCSLIDYGAIETHKDENQGKIKGLENCPGKL